VSFADSVIPATNSMRMSGLQNIFPLLASQVPPLVIDAGLATMLGAVGSAGGKPAGAPVQMGASP
jgi:hypothetical protein